MTLLLEKKPSTSSLDELTLILPTKNDKTCYILYNSDVDNMETTMKYPLVIFRTRICSENDFENWNHAFNASVSNGKKFTLFKKSEMTAIIEIRLYGYKNIEPLIMLVNTGYQDSTMTTIGIVNKFSQKDWRK